MKTQVRPRPGDAAQRERGERERCPAPAGTGRRAGLYAAPEARVPRGEGARARGRTPPDGARAGSTGG